ncbi:putative enoyl-CoA hydratase [Lachnellula suecica]|uniref:Putative enoyl-CoA hydratase n=1 Tax=Lachnellula suecica TaxID=602035 RepID=A0A8T9C540_9HELO|nr:putative enoyl-CoA hydratase [Lachnellula suecica]
MVISNFASPPPETQGVLVTFPIPRVLLATINLEKRMNALPARACFELDALWKWFDEESELCVGIITGAGKKAFSAGMDLKEQGADYSKFTYASHYPATGFAGLTRRTGKKPIIAAVNGHAHGGGFEIALNSDLVIASPNANFRLPDVLRGTAALEGAFPRICRTFGLQRAMLLTLTAYTLHAKEAREWGLVLKIVPAEKLVDEAVKLAGWIAAMSPDSVVISRAGVREAWKTASVDEVTNLTLEKYADVLMKGDNAKEGMLAFAEKRKPKWVPSKL